MSSNYADLIHLYLWPTAVPADQYSNQMLKQTRVGAGAKRVKSV